MPGWLKHIFTRHAALLGVLLIIIFVLQVFPPSHHGVAYNVTFTVLLIVTAISLQAGRRVLFASIAAGLIVLHWLAILLEQSLLLDISQAAKAVYFAVVVTGLIHQTAIARHVTAKVIIDSICGYLLLGMVLSLGTIMISQWDSAAYTFTKDSASGHEPRFSDSIYYTFITFTTTGYGDMLPLTPAAQSFSMFIAACGQLYIAIIIALLVGKYSNALVARN